MKKFKNVRSHVVPIALKDVDTDMIIPAQYLKGTGFGGYGEHVFARLKESDPSFAFNQTQYENAEIIVAESNFGCGSSREHAVWALMEAGIKVIIAPSFSD
ncbi:MAG: 3-isopropylmalate dehydratase small subunit, partial [Coxiella sp. (in: Bacteria)]